VSSPLNIFGAFLILSGLGIIGYLVWVALAAQRRRANDSYERSLHELERWRRDETLPGPPRGPRRR
jgi:hypothetical protein